MNEAALAAVIAGSFELLRNHLNKPPGWKPTMQDIEDLNARVDLATPENEKAAARARLGIPAEQDTPQAPPGN